MSARSKLHATRIGFALAISCAAALLASAGLGGSVHAAPRSKADTGAAPGGITGMWWIEDFQPRLIPDGGGEPPFTPEGRNLYQKNVAQLASGELKDPGTSICLIEGLPRTLFAAYPFQIVEHGKYVTLIHEINHSFWSIALDGKHSSADDVEPAFLGESVGRWDHGTLLVDTIGFKGRTFLDETGLPHSDKLHVMLRVRRVSPKRLEVMATIEDPDIFTSPWTAKRTFEWRPDITLTDYVCGEPHRVLTGTRAAAIPLKWIAK